MHADIQACIVCARAPKKTKARQYYSALQRSHTHTHGHTHPHCTTHNLHYTHTDTLIQRTGLSLAEMSWLSTTSLTLSPSNTPTDTGYPQEKKHLLETPPTGVMFVGGRVHVAARTRNRILVYVRCWYHECWTSPHARGRIL